MSFYSKIKICILVPCVAFLCYLHLYSKAFFRENIETKWTKLTWDHFQGIVKPFSPYSASIYSEIKVSYDTISDRYISYAIQENQFSWKKSSVGDDKHLLRHEQYHFNLTEYYSRRMNSFLRVNNIESTDDFMGELNRLSKELGKAQNLYDTETNHNLNTEEQKRWEAKIDSMLKETNLLYEQ
ncbi:hypothetical protein ACJRPK_08920 [Aquimarina sp. 2-A2]|uniref:hypothetical protein n=1 Tax=Aquimarina sp. 2-A2 TaxID=3382644 RepID=UPI00387F0472